MAKNGRGFALIDTDQKKNENFAFKNSVGIRYELRENKPCVIMDGR